jgi:glyoxylase-like metal-dependent hydrolase (beta-lactamase superfamily II)
MYMIEVVPGIYRIETKRDGNLLCLHLLRGERTLLIDSGVHDTPDTAIYPALAAAGLPEQIDLLLLSHADADHHGGNAGIRARSPHVTIMCHEFDRRRVETKEHYLRARFDDVVAADDVRYPPDFMARLSDTIGPDTPVDVGLRGGETIWLGSDMRYEVIHAPGHSAGHMAVWDRVRRTLVIQDAVLWRGVPNLRGKVPSPPAYYYAGAYIDTVRRLQGLEPELLLAAHFPVIRGAEVAAFFATSLAFVEKVDQAVLGAVRGAGRPLSLSGVIEAIDARLGPFSTPIEWVGAVLAHLGQHVAARRLSVRTTDSGRVWEPA